MQRHHLADGNQKDTEMLAVRSRSAGLNHFHQDATSRNTSNLGPASNELCNQQLLYEQRRVKQCKAEVDYYNGLYGAICTAPALLQGMPGGADSQKGQGAEAVPQHDGQRHPQNPACWAPSPSL